MTAHEKNRLDTMAEEIENLKEQLAEMKVMVKDIHDLLAGSPLDPDSKGLVRDYRETKKSFYDLRDEFKKYKSYIWALITLIGVGAVKIITDFLK
jgi:hypothetical protein